MKKARRPEKRRHVPQRTCIACREVAGKRTLVRLVRTGEGIVEVDPTGKKNGRGAYLHASPACWERALAGKQIERALRTKLNDENRTALETYMRSLTSDTDAASADQ